MDLNYTVVGIVVFAILALLFFLIWRNQRDKKTYEKESIDAETPVEKHDREKI